MKYHSIDRIFPWSRLTLEAAPTNPGEPPSVQVIESDPIGFVPVFNTAEAALAWGGDEASPIRVLGTAPGTCTCYESAPGCLGPPCITVEPPKAGPKLVKLPGFDPGIMAGGNFGRLKEPLDE